MEEYYSPNKAVRLLATRLKKKQRKGNERVLMKIRYKNNNIEKYPVNHVSYNSAGLS